MRLSRITVLALVMGSAAGCSSVPIADMIERYDGPIHYTNLVAGPVDSSLTGPILPEPRNDANYVVGDEAQMFSSTEPGPLTR